MMIDLPDGVEVGWRGREEELEALFKRTYPILVQEVSRFHDFHGDVDELAIEAFWRVARGALREDSSEPSLSYLKTAARWSFIDHIRTLERQQKELEDALREGPLGYHDSVGDLIRSRKASEILDRAMDQARRSGDRTTFRVATLLLDITEIEGRVPSDRRVARELGISHVAVGKARSRLRSLLKEARESIGLPD